MPGLIGYDYIERDGMIRRVSPDRCGRFGVSSVPIPLGKRRKTGKTE
jgi:hypothetical protein